MFGENTAPTTQADNFSLEQGEVIYPPDWAGCHEMRRFSAKEREGTGGAKDDHVMSWAAGWAWIEEVERLSSGFEKTRARWY